MQECMIGQIFGVGPYSNTKILLFPSTDYAPRCIAPWVLRRLAAGFNKIRFDRIGMYEPHAHGLLACSEQFLMV